MSSRIPQLSKTIIELRQVRPLFPIFVHLQYYSALGIQSMLARGVFRDPDPLITTFDGLAKRVVWGVKGEGTSGWNRMAQWGKWMPHETMIVAGPVVHIPQDIRGGLKDALREHNRLPDPEDYKQMYAAVRASMMWTRVKLLLEVGGNTTSSAIGLNEAIIRRSGRDPIQWLRDIEYMGLGGELPPGLPDLLNIDMAREAIEDDPSSKDPIFKV